jgi:N-succinyldiaminopimelate aminotransferase
LAPYPHVSQAVTNITGSVYSGLAHRIATFAGQTYPLHIGDTWMEPAAGCRMQDLTVAEHPGMHRYAEPRGMPQLLDAIALRSSQRLGVATASQDVLVAAGATGGLDAVVGAILEPGDKVMILAPFWPLIKGIVQCYGGVPIEVPVLGTVDSPETVRAQLDQLHQAGTVALYLSTPNNPSGLVLPPAWVEAIVAWAQQRDLWILADEVYEDYVFEGVHTYARALAPERTFSVHSFSKAFGMAGNRCGFVVGPTATMPDLLKVSTHSFYSTPTASQLAVIRALEGPGDAWVADVKPRYQAAGEHAAQRLGVPAPQGSTFLFLDVAAHLDASGLGGFLTRCADDGLFLAPGPSFGPYPTHVRICFTAAPPDIVADGVEILARHLGR